MWIYEKKLQYPVRIKNPNPALAKLIISQYGGPHGELGASLRYLSQQHLLADQQESVMKEITAAIHEIVSGVEYEDAFYSQILDKMVVQSKDTVDVYLNLLPIKWSYAVAKASKGVLDPKSGISETEIPISVNIARSSG